VTWSQTWCPDGTHSHEILWNSVVNPDNTCLGHLTP
jgi:hypothetical protein